MEPWYFFGGPANLLALVEDTFQVESPYVQDQAVDTVTATGGTAPYSYEIVSQSKIV